MSKRLRDSQWDRHGVIERMLSNVKIPKMAKIAQKFDNNRIEDIPAAIRSELGRPEIAEGIKPGSSIAITVGSRGITNIALITRKL